jgi:hypothetical protein
MVFGIIHHGGSPSYMGPWFSILLQHYGPHLSMGPGIWLYFLITSVEDNAFITGMECSVARGNNMGCLGRYPRGIMVDKYCYV